MARMVGRQQRTHPERGSGERKIKMTPGLHKARVIFIVAIGFILAGIWFFESIDSSHQRDERTTDTAKDAPRPHREIPQPQLKSDGPDLPVVNKNAPEFSSQPPISLNPLKDKKETKDIHDKYPPEIQTPKKEPDQTLLDSNRPVRGIVINCDTSKIDELVELYKRGHTDALLGLIDLFKEDGLVPTLAANTLEVLGDKSVIPKLLLLLNDENPDVRYLAVSVLRELGDKDIVPKLLTMLKDPNRGVRYSVAEALGKFGDKSAVPYLLDILDDEASYIRETVIVTLGKLGDKSVVPYLLNVLDDKENNVRKAAIKTLGMLGDKSAVEPLISMLKDVDDLIRIEAVRALGNIGDKSAMPALLEALKTNKLNIVRCALIDALGKLGDTNAVPALLDMLNDNKNMPVVASAAGALIKLGVNEGYAKLNEMLESDKENNKIMAARSYIHLKNNKGIKSFINIMRSGKQQDLDLDLDFIDYKAAIPALIDEFQGDAIDNDISKTLKKLSGEDFGKDKAKWRDWWEANKERILKEGKKEKK